MVNIRENDTVNIFSSDNRVEHGNLILGVDSSNVAKFLKIDSSGKLEVASSSSSSGSSYTERMAYNGSNLVEYVGKATPGTATSAATWQIKKFIYSGNYVTEILFANGSADFSNIWDNHSSLSYS